MKKPGLAGIIALALVAVIALGGLSALAKGGPLADSGSPATTEEDDSDDADVTSDEADDQDEDEATNEEDADDQDEDDEAEAGDGAEHIAQVIADEFGVTQEEVLALHQQGIGFGALFKLYAIAAAKGMSVDDLLATLETNAEGEFEFAFGELKKSLTEEELAALEAGAKNLGQLVSASHKDNGDEEEGETTESAPEASSHGNGHGPPDFAKAHGRR